MPHRITTELAKPENELTRGHKKKAKTRQQLLDAALAIYSRKGVAELTLYELAEEAGVSNGTVYNYFKDKEEVLAAVGIAIATQVSEHLLDFNSITPSGVARVSRGVRAYILRAIEQPEWTKALIRVLRYAEGMRAALATYILADLRTGFEQGDFKYADEDVAVDLVISCAASAMVMITEGKAIDQHDSVVAEMVLLALGAPAEKAKQIAYMPLVQL